MHVRIFFSVVSVCLETNKILLKRSQTSFHFRALCALPAMRLLCSLYGRIPRENLLSKVGLFFFQKNKKSEKCALSARLPIESSFSDMPHYLVRDITNDLNNMPAISGKLLFCANG